MLDHVSFRSLSSQQPKDEHIAVEIEGAEFAWVDQTQMSKMKTTREKQRVLKAKGEMLKAEDVEMMNMARQD